MTKKFFYIVLSSIMALVTCMTMFMVKYEVVQKEDELYRVNREIISNQKEIHILKAEFAHLTDPQRLRVLAKKYTDLQEVKPFQIIELSDITKADKSVQKASYQNGGN